MIRQRLHEVIQAKTAWGIVLFLLVVHALVERQGGYLACVSWYEFWGLTSASLLQGKVWQLVTYAALHGSWMHLLTNALMIVFLSASLQVIFAGRVCLRVFLLGCVGGGMAHALLGGSSDILVGASGGAMGLLLFLCTLSPQSRMLPVFLSAGNVGLGVMISSLLLTLLNPALHIPGISYLSSLLEPQWQKELFSVGHACHLGGCIAGWLSARWVLRRRVTLAQLQQQRRKREAGNH